MANIRHPGLRVAVASVSLALAIPVTFADDPGQTTPSPGFRPDIETTTDFITSLGTAKVAVFPSMVRRESRTAHSFSSQRLAVALLNESGLLDASLANKRIKLGNLQRVSQWDLFQYGLRTVRAELQDDKPDADYLLVLEFLVPDNQNVFGIEFYLIDHRGQNVFSFLLNSHHQMFVDAKLHARDTSEDAREAMLLDATRGAIAAFERQVEQARTENPAQAASAAAAATLSADAARMRVMIITRLHERLTHVFMHSFKHSVISGFESNGIDAGLLYVARDSHSIAEFDQAIKAFAADAVLTIDISPLLRRRRDGYEAIVGTVFDVSMTDTASGAVNWQMSDKVDYIRMFGPRYVAHAGILKEFAWHTTEAIVSRFMQDVRGTESVRIYTVTEERERHGQRID